MKRIDILSVVNADERDLQNIAAHLPRDGEREYKIQKLRLDRADFAEIARGSFCVILMADHFAGEAQDALKKIFPQDNLPIAPVLVLSRNITTSFTNKVLCAGAMEYLSCEKLNQEDLFRKMANAEKRFALLKRLRAEEETLKLAAAATGFGSFDYEVESRSSVWSEELYQITGVDPRESVAADLILSLIHPDDRKIYQDHMLALIHSQVAREYKIEYRILKEGKVRWVRDAGRSFLRIQNDQSSVYRIIGAIQDITEEKEYQNHIRELANRLEMENKRKDEFLAVLGHELRNPLAPIQAGVEALELFDDQQTRHEIIETLKRQIRHIAHLVDDLLDISRVSRGTIKLQKSVEDFGRLAQDAISSVKSSVNNKRQRLRVSLPTKKTMVCADKTRIAQIMSNLLNNASKFTPEKGEISFSVREENDCLEISVKDTGAGIAEDNLEKIFEMFSQIDPPAGTQSGLGIGLTLARSLARQHGGDIQVKSEGPGKGSKFLVRMPIVWRREEKDFIPAKENEHFSKKRVLVVDDNLDSLRMLSMLLEKQGYEVRSAANGKEAVEVAQYFKPDIALMDLGMPVMDGYQAAKAIKATDWGKDVKLIALSGWGQSGDRAKTKAAGFEHHLVKPVSVQALRSFFGGRI